jgi:hypothetical protein
VKFRSSDFFTKLTVKIWNFLQNDPPLQKRPPSANPGYAYVTGFIIHFVGPQSASCGRTGRHICAGWVWPYPDSWVFGLKRVIHSNSFLQSRSRATQNRHRSRHVSVSFPTRYGFVAHAIEYDSAKCRELSEWPTTEAERVNVVLGIYKHYPFRH